MEDGGSLERMEEGWDGRMDEHYKEWKIVGMVEW